MSFPVVPHRFPMPARAVLPLAFLGLLVGCGPRVQHYALVDLKQAQQRFAEADAVVEENKDGYGARNAILYFLDRAMMLHLAGDYAQSNRFLDQAEKRIDELYTKSLTAQTGAMLTNDNTLPYEGEDFEKVLIHVLGALNYSLLGQWDEALVEARKVDHRIDLLNDRYEKKNVYKEDGLAFYLSGLLYEAKGEINDAFIAYRKALGAYESYQKNYGTPLPPVLASDLLRVTDSLGLTEEHETYRKRFPGTSWTTEKDLKSQSEVIFLSYSGRSPVKEDFFIDAPIPDGKNGIYILRVALPKFVPQPNPVTVTEVHLIPVDGGGGPRPGAAISRRAFLAEDIAAIAKKDLEDRIARITAKAIARATAKYLASRAVRKGVADKTGNDPLAGLLTSLGTNIYSLASEQSDKRSWRTLPGEIRMARLTAPPGTYTLAVEYYDSTGGFMARKSFPPMVLKAGEKKFLNHRILGRQ